MTADDIIERLELSPHPEGGWFRQTWIGDETPRASGTCIYFLLKAGERSHWHKVDATEIWLYHAGAPLTLHLSETETGPARTERLTPDLSKGRPQIIVPENHWQAAQSTGAYTLVSCTVAPGFEFSGFEMAPDDWFPRPRPAGGTV